MLTIQRTHDAARQRFEAIQRLSLVVTPRPGNPCLFDARIGGRLICTSREPFLESARVLLAEGVNPAAVLTMH